MIYLAWIIWVLLLFFISLATIRIWHSLVRSRNFNFFVLPGILVHQLSVALASVITGATVTHISIRGESQEYLTHTRSKIPVLGQVLIGLAPLFGCSLALWGAMELLSHPINIGFSLPESIQVTASGLQQSAKSLIDVIAETLRAIQRADFGDWKTYVFLYLSITFAFTIAPAKKDLKTTIIALAVLAAILLVIDLIGAKISGGPVLNEYFASYWKILTYALAISIGFFLVSLLILGFCKLFGLVPSTPRK